MSDDESNKPNTKDEEEEEDNKASVAFDDEEGAANTTKHSSDDENDEKNDKNDNKQQLMQDIFGADSDEEDNKLEATSTDFVFDDNKIDIANLPQPNSANLSSFYFRMPKNVALFQPIAFDKQQFAQQCDQLQHDIYSSNFNSRAEVTARRQMVATDNVIRWRSPTSTMEQASLQSNARLVKWSDGTYQMYIGNEPYDLNTQDASLDNIFLFAKADEKHLYGHGKICTKFVFAPSIVSKRAQKQFQATLSEKSFKKEKKIKLASFAENDAKASIAEEEEKMRVKQNRKMEKASVADTKLSADFLEDENPDVSIKNLKNKYRGKKNAAAGKKRKRTSTRRKKEESDQDDDDENDNHEEEEEAVEDDENDDEEEEEFQFGAEDDEDEDDEDADDSYKQRPAKKQRKQ